MTDLVGETSRSVGSPAKPPFVLGAVSGNAAPIVGKHPATQQSKRIAQPEPVFNNKMKEPGLTTLPSDTLAHDRSSSSMSTPAISHVPYAQPEPAKTVSNLLSLAALTLVVDDLFSRPNIQSAPHSARKTKYATEEERRKAISIALKGTCWF